MKQKFTCLRRGIVSACLALTVIVCVNAQNNPAIVDDLNDFTKIHSSSSQLHILSEEVDIEKFDFDTVLEMGDGSTSNSFLIYKNNTDIQTLLIHGYRYRTHDAGLRFFLSDTPDGTYTEITSQMSFRIGPKQAFTNWTHIIYELNDVNTLFPGMRYLKMTFSDGSWKNSPTIGSVNINAAMDSEYVNEFKGYTPNRLVNETNKHAHPRIRMNQNDFDNVNVWASNGSNADLAKAITTALSEADKVLSLPLITRTLDNNGYLLTTSREVLSRMEKLGMGYKLSNNANKKNQYITKAYADLAEAANWTDWKPDHFLDVAEMTAAYAIAYDWMYDGFSDVQKNIIRRAIIDKGLKNAWDAYSGRCVWYNWENNMNTVNNSGIMLGALAIIGDVDANEENLCGKILLEGMKSVQYSLTGYAPAGGYKEGPSYWAYGTKYLIWLITSLQKNLETDLGLIATPGLEKTGYYPAHVSGGWDKRNFNYADSGDDKYSWVEVWWFAKQFNDAALMQYCKTDKKAISIPYYEPTLYNSTGTAIEKSHYFEGPELFFTRNIWDGNAGAWTQWMGFKAGTPQVSHGDMDMGTFVIDALGDRWSCDLGAEDYNANDIWDWQGKPEGKRYDYYRKNPEGHNCVLINPDNTQHQDALAFSPIEKTFISDKINYAIADLTPAYHKKTPSYKRGVKTILDKIELNRDRFTFIIQDEIENKTTSDEIYWFMHTKQQITIHDDKKTATLSNQNNQMNKVVVKILSPANATFETMDAKALSGSRKPSKTDAVNTGVKKLSIHLQDIKESTTISVAIIPVRTALKYGGTPDKDPSAQDWPNVIPLSQWKKTISTSLTSATKSEDAKFSVCSKNQSLLVRSIADEPIKSVKIYNMFGTVIFSGENINANETQLSTPGTGVYIIEINPQSVCFRSKISVQN